MQKRDKSGRFKLQFDTIKKNYLINNYHKKTVNEMAKQLGVTDATIRCWRREHTSIKRKDSFIKCNVIKKMTQCQLAYIAGLLDGEGNISINMFNNKIMYPKVYVTNTSLKAIKYLQKATGIGNIHAHMEPTRFTSNRKPTYIWGVTNLNDVKNFLKLILPFLIIKNKQAKLSIQLVNIRKKQMRRDKATGRFLKYTPNDKEMKIFQLNKKLNRRGL